jgi:threonine dehydratase
MDDQETAPKLELRHVLAAQERIAGKVHRTPLFSAAALGERAGVRLFLKCESFQKTGSFKARGALNKILSLPAALRVRGVVTVSAGNHAQALAWAARLVEAPCVVVMPKDAPRSKVDAVRGYAAEIVFHDDRSTLFDKLAEVRDERGLTFVHPFDDPVVLAGAGTAGLEIVEDLPEVDLVIVPVGGGGLLGGVATAVKSMRPEARVVAVELAAGPGLAVALAAGRPVPVPRPVGTLADGMTPPFVGSLPLEIVRRLRVELQTVTEDEIAAAMRALAGRAKLVAEGSGAAATAGLLSGRITVRPGSVVVALVSGGNVDPDRLGAVLAS